MKPQRQPDLYIAHRQKAIALTQKFIDIYTSKYPNTPGMVTCRIQSDIDPEVRTNIVLFAKVSGITLSFTGFVESKGRFSEVRHFWTDQTTTSLAQGSIIVDDLIQGYNEINALLEEVTGLNDFPSTVVVTLTTEPEEGDIFYFLDGTPFEFMEGGNMHFVEA